MKTSEDTSHIACGRSSRSQVEKQEILIKVQEDGSQSFRSDLAALEHRIWEEFAPKTSVAQVFATASEAHTKLDFAMMDRATIRQRMEEEACHELHGRVLQHIDEQVIKCQATADSLSSCSTRISLEHMEKSLGLRQSLDELSQDHSQLKSLGFASSI
eukprot:g3418.t1